MSTHPNAILKCTLTPNGLTRQTHRAIVNAYSYYPDQPQDKDLKIGGKRYHSEIMESDYNQAWQLSGAEGDILVFDLVTYGYGEEIAWDDLVQQRNELAAWSEEVCREHNCSYKISVTANYW